MGKELAMVVLMVLWLLIGAMFGFMAAESAMFDDTHSKAVALGHFTHAGKLYIIRPAKVVEE